MLDIHSVPEHELKDLLSGLQAVSILSGLKNVTIGYSIEENKTIESE
jgi:pyridoxal/pyridoxine/pyridoxamine kinase